MKEWSCGSERVEWANESERIRASVRATRADESQSLPYIQMNKYIETERLRIWPDIRFEAEIFCWSTWTEPFRLSAVQNIYRAVCESVYYEIFFRCLSLSVLFRYFALLSVSLSHFFPLTRLAVCVICFRRWFCFCVVQSSWLSHALK